MPTRRLIVLALLMGCRSEPTSAPDPVPAVPVEPVAALAAKVTTQLTDGELERVASTLAAVRYDDHARELSPAEIKARQHQLAPLVAHDILAAWETIRSSELTSAEERGVDRARGLAATYSSLHRELAWVSAESPAVATRWAALASELARIEQAAFERESNDPRPLVWVRPKQEDGVIVMGCVASALRTRFPAYRWVETGADREGEPTLWIVARAGNDTYSNTRTHEKLEMLSALEVQLVPEHVPPELAKHFRKPISAGHSTRSPTEIASVTGNTAPVMEATKVGMRKLEQLESVLCESLGRAIAAAR